jgi:hypothetical protein
MRFELLSPGEKTRVNAQIVEVPVWGIQRTLSNKMEWGVSQTFHLRMSIELVPETLHFFGALKYEQSETEEFWVRYAIIRNLDS